MVRVNILIAGVGGQGIITMGKMISNAASIEGVKVMVAETHGLAQRGGAVNIHVRLGNVYYPLIPKGGADYIVGLEASEALRNLEYSNEGTVFVINKLSIRPVLPKVKAMNVEEVLSIIKGRKHYLLDAKSLADQAGNSKTMNSVLLGFLYGIGAFRGLIREKSFEESLKSEENRRAFKLGLNEAIKLVTLL
jgi:indolepyruvate ferredoxin oxidoreductase beta subunit